MHTNSLNIIQKFIDKYFTDKDLRILDLGSRVVAGQEHLGTYRQFITNPKWKYVGVDLVKGNNVDIVILEYRLPFEDNFFDFIISGQTIEHVEYPWVWFKELARVLKPGGLCCIVAPAVIHEHRYPIDTFRYYPDGMRALAKWSGLNVIETKRITVNAKMADTYLIAKKQ